MNCDDRDFASMLRVTTAPDSERPEDTVAIVLLQMPLEACVADERWDENAEFIVHARTDVPRLIELVGEMAEALEAALEHLSLGQYVASPGKCRVCGGYVHTKCLTVCEQCAARMVREVLTKYHGEVENA